MKNNNIIDFKGNLDDTKFLLNDSIGGDFNMSSIKKKI